MVLRALNLVRIWRRRQCPATRMSIACTVWMDMHWSICCRKTMNQHRWLANEYCADIHCKNQNELMSLHPLLNHCTRYTTHTIHFPLAKYASKFFFTNLFFVICRFTGSTVRSVKIYRNSKKYVKKSNLHCDHYETITSVHWIRHRIKFQWATSFTVSSTICGLIISRFWSYHDR